MLCGGICFVFLSPFAFGPLSWSVPSAIIFGLLLFSGLGCEQHLLTPRLTHGEIALDIGKGPPPSAQLLQRGGAVRIDGLRARDLA